MGTWPGIWPGLREWLPQVLVVVVAATSFLYMSQGSALHHMSSAGVFCIPPHCSCVILPIQLACPRWHRSSLCSKAIPVIPNWEQTQQPGRYVFENASRVLPHTVQAACIPHPFEEGRSPNKCSAMSPPKWVPCLLFLRLLFAPAWALYFSLTSNPIVPLLWLSRQNYLSLGSGHSCPCSAYKRKGLDGAVWVRRQNLKSVSAGSAAAPSLSKNTPNTASRGRGGQFLEEGPYLFPGLRMQLLWMCDYGGCLWKSTLGTI